MKKTILPENVKLRKKREKIKYAAAVALFLALLLAGIAAATHKGDFYAPSDGSVYARAKVCEIIRSEGELDDDGVLIYGDITFLAEIKSGENKGDIVEINQNLSSDTPLNPRQVKKGDSIIAANFEWDEKWHFVEFVRSDAIAVLALIFAALLIIFGRKKGIKTVFSLVLTVIAVVFVFMPAVLSGGNIYFWAVAVCIYMIVMTLVITSGLSPMSLAASLGCVGGVLASLSLTLVTDFFIKISPNADSHSIYLMYIGDGLDVRALIYAAVIIGSVGAVMDVSVDIAASLKELTVKLRTPSMRELFRSGLNIGRDVIGTMANTLVLAYIGGSMCSLLLYFYNNASNAVYLFNIEIIVVEMLNILVGSIGILLTLPLTALISARIYTIEKMRAHILSEAEEALPDKTLSKENLHEEDIFSDRLEEAGIFQSGQVLSKEGEKNEE
ncbi:MAG: YibE/F family protein [Clostridia bacterium]|nr:YibE/F family protein [Clostridia bacterium]